MRRSDAYICPYLAEEAATMVPTTINKKQRIKEETTIEFIASLCRVE